MVKNLKTKSAQNGKYIAQKEKQYIDEAMIYENYESVKDILNKCFSILNEIKVMNRYSSKMTRQLTNCMKSFKNTIQNNKLQSNLKTEDTNVSLNHVYDSIPMSKGNDCEAITHTQEIMINKDNTIQYDDNLNCNVRQGDIKFDLESNPSCHESEQGNRMSSVTDEFKWFQSGNKKIEHNIQQDSYNNNNQSNTVTHKKSNPNTSANANKAIKNVQQIGEMNPNDFYTNIANLISTKMSEFSARKDDLRKCVER